jgi:hypothetical protein
MSVTAFPLAWPLGWKRTSVFGRQRAAFQHDRKPLTLERARRRLTDELDRLGAIDEVLSTNLLLRADGWPKSDQRLPDDPGVAVYFDYAGRATVLACDKWDRVADNIAAIAKHIEAMRGMDRWGVGTVEQAFTGYAALPSPDPWWKTLGLAGPTRSERDIKDAYRKASNGAHPDRPGGSHDRMAALNAARDEALKLIGVVT